MKKQHIIFGISIFTVLVTIAVGIFLLTRPTIREWTGEDAAHNSVNTRGVFVRMLYEGRSVIGFADFATAQEEVFCANPICQHNNSDCFAVSLISTYNARNFAIMGEHIYFTSARYNPTAEYRHVVDVFESTFTGGNLRNIARIERRDGFNIWQSHMIDGYYVLQIGASDFSHPTFYYIIIDLRTGESWEIPAFEKGYYSNMRFISLVDGKAIFYFTYFSREVTMEEMQELSEELGNWHLAQIYFDQFRTSTHYIANIKERTITPCEFNPTALISYPDKTVSHNYIISFDNKIFLTTSVLREDGLEHGLNQLIDINTGEILREFDFTEGNGMISGVDGNYLLIRFDNGFAVFCISTERLRYIDALNETNGEGARFATHSRNRLQSNLAFFLDTSEEGFGTTNVVAIRDLFYSGIENMRTIRHSDAEQSLRPR